MIDNIQTHSVLSQLAIELRELRALVGDLRGRLDGTTKPLLTVEEVARLSGRAPYTVRAWIKQGRIAATRVRGTGPRGRLLIARAELERVIEGGLGSLIPTGIVASETAKHVTQT